MQKFLALALVLVCFLPLAHAAPAVSAPSQRPPLTFDIGASTGQSGNLTYTEVDVGLNYFAKDWLAWRNAVFGRLQNSSQSVYGLDSSLRVIGEVGDNKTGLTMFVGPGYRFASGIDSSPFAEEGLVIHLGGVHIGGGAKQILNSWVHSGVANDNQYFLILGGGGSL